MSVSPRKHSDWEPLTNPLFRGLWIATMVSNVGSAMQDAVSPAFMTRLTDSKLIVALVQAAAALPIFLLALPAGALADLLDRRRLLVATQLWMLGAAGLLGFLTFAHMVWPGVRGSAWVLLALTFLLGIGAAMSGPAFLRVLPELVPAEQMPSAMALNSIALNVARALGPALGGLAIYLAGPGAAFMFNAASFAAVAWVLWRWRHPPERHPTSAEGFIGAMRAGIHYTRYAPRLQAVLLRVAVFISCASAMWALTVVLARWELGLKEIGYCMLMAFLGAGAIVGILLMPRVQRRISTDRMVAGATAIFAAAVLALALCRVVALSCAIMFVVGADWVVILTNFNVATQRAVPAWVKGRAMSMYLLTLWGSWAAGAVFWGNIARLSSAHVALCGAAGGLALGLLAALPLRLVPAVAIDFTPAFAGPVPPAGDGAGPVQVAVEYHVKPGRTDEFLMLMGELRPQRLRNGARKWALLERESGTGEFTERFSFLSPAEFARQRSRITRSQAQVQERLRALADGGEERAGAS
jgi:predicted MFS family arabinose efflux permease